MLLIGFQFTLNGQLPNLPMEEINLITDRDIYLSGESIWFSASVQFLNNEKALSQILYLELFNANQKSISRKKFRIQNGQAQGAFEIPAEFVSDVYFLRAYTHFNKNFSSDHYFYTALQIVNPKIGIAPKSDHRLAEAIAENTNHLRPDFQIKTETTANGQNLVFLNRLAEIPEMEEEFYTLSLLNSKLQLQSHWTVNLRNNTASVVLSPINASGIYYLQLKNSKDELLAIQAFISPSAKIPAFHSIQAQQAKQREEITFTLAENEFQEFENLGIKTVLKGTNLPTIQKLKLYSENPHLLFSYLKTQFTASLLSKQESELFLADLNRKLNTAPFKKVFCAPNATDLNWLPEIRDVGLSGVVVDKLSQKPMAKVPVYLSLFRAYPQIHIFDSRDDGSFVFSINNFENEQDVFLCLLHNNADNLEIKINNEFSMTFPNLKPFEMTIDSSQTEMLEQMYVAMQTASAYKINNKTQNLNISHLPYSFENPQVSILLDDYIETPNLEMVFKELVPNVRVRKQKENFKLSIFDSELELFYNDPLILVDNIPVFNENELMKIAPANIEKIELHKTPFILGSHTINGIIMIKTTTDDFGGMIMPESATFLKYQTVNTNYIFQTNFYATSSEKQSKAADFRTLLFWNPRILEVAKPLHFYTSDQTANYETIVFGTLKNGNPFQYPIPFSVAK